MNIRPMGARLRVRCLTMEMKTGGGIIIPRAELPGAAAKADAKAAMEQMQAMSTLQLAEIIDVGEGTWNQEKGCYNGTRYKIGQKVLFRCGPSAQVHLDSLPAITGAAAEELLIQESMIAALIEGELVSA